MNIEQFKKARADELRRAADILQRVISGTFNSSPIYDAAQRLESTTPKLKNGCENLNYWGYEIEDLQLPIELFRHIRPIGIKGAVLTLNMKLVADYTLWNTLNDPLIDLNFNVVVRGIGKVDNHYLGFHIDKHEISSLTDEAHPVYHLHYLINPLDIGNFEYGHSLQMDSPRIMHYPVDFILGVGFLTSNFFPAAFDCLIEDGYFTSLYKNYQASILKPYSHTLASHWDFNKDDITWGPTKDLCPFLI